MEKTKERRNLASPVKLTETESRTVEGYALLFNTPSDGLPIEEIIDTGALEGVIARSNVFALLDHDKQRGILARSKNGVGTLELIVDEKGLLYRFEAPNTTLGDEVLEYLRRGDITESSFCFTVESDTWEKKSDGTWKRTIHQFDELYDVSPVYDAAYSATSVCLRGKEQAEKELEERAKQTEQMGDEYYEQFLQTF
jgi:HK97 family phage prohead protease